jgi:hypothetical protein
MALRNAMPMTVMSACQRMCFISIETARDMDDAARCLALALCSYRATRRAD